MKKVLFDEWELKVDFDQTKQAYELIAEVGGTNKCDCSPCKNFRFVGEKAFPRSILELLKSLGVDFCFPAECFHVYRVKPGIHHYGGWFHFIGGFCGREIRELMSDGKGYLMNYKEVENNFHIGFSKEIALLDPVFEGKNIVQLEFASSVVPWELIEEEPE